MNTSGSSQRALSVLSAAMAGVCLLWNCRAPSARPPVSQPPARHAAAPGADPDAPWGHPQAGRLLRKRAFTLGYDGDRRQPLWVAYRVDRENVGLKGLTKRRFVPDPEIPRSESAWDSDYRHSGYDRGHMAPFASVRRPDDPTPEAESCHFSNICPQRPRLNRDAWADLEEQVRRWALAYGQVWVLVGPEFEPNPGRLPSGRVTVPSAFYMIVARMGEDGPRVLAFTMGQDVEDRSRRFERYLVSVREVERATGLDFFSSLPKEVQDSLELVRPQEAELN